jgi:cbb3-type cytochrome oxidase subunit 1
MKSIASMFFAIGAVFALVGMIWGIQMSASQDHTLSPAHGHLNLLGFAAMSLFGSYYALSPQAAAAGLAKLHLGLATLSVIVLVPGIVMAITERGEGMATSGSILAVLSMLLFLVIVLRHPIGQRHS